MQLEQYVSQHGDTFHFSREQASLFAKRIADDFNPIHDVDAKRFCVPGDLLFTVALSELGLQESMNIRFADMVTENTELHFKSAETGQHDIRDEADKVYLSIEASGNRSDKREQNLKLAEQYVAFSGKTFPHVLVPLWKEHNVMVNPARPLVIYESMTLSMETLDFDTPTIALSGSSLEVNGKRGNVRLDIEITEKDKVIGRGQKRMLLSGLKPYDQDAIDDLITFYDQRKIDLA
ncbi:MAG: hypothetical protein CL693_08520 [Cellvibrionaceae bacterium]|nr:hypothetical protein [Cellvibrionaceae bacterium]|tara:strand:- start:30494 stop:31198 length:705 start_codon:yes stop_codon:yes gene_type:complete